MPDISGYDVGRYHIVEKLGEGGMAVVYKAFDTRLERDVAIKVIRVDLVAAAYQGHMLKRFEREAKSLARLSHPNILKVHDFGEYLGAPYLVMEYMPGGTLKNLTGNSMPFRKAAGLLSPVARALEYAHQENIIHRDHKPANILLTKTGMPMLSDFGIAKILDLDETSQLTGTGEGIGTPEYMAPEQWENKVLPQTDIYALGVVFYELVTGHKPYTADTPAAVLRKQLVDPLPKPTLYIPDLPEVVEKIIYKALAKQPEMRYASMGDFAAALEKLALPANIVPGPVPAETAAAGNQVDTLAAPIEERTSPGSQRINLTAEAPLFKTDITRDDLQPNDLLTPKQSSIPTRVLILGGLLVLGLGFGLLVLGIGMVRMSGIKTAMPGGEAKLVATQQVTLQASPQPQLSPTPESTKTPLATATITPTPGMGSIQISDKDGMPMDYVPAGEFQMGSTEAQYRNDLKLCTNSGTGLTDCTEIFGFQNEKPAHTVSLNAYWIDQVEVTNSMYAQCVRAGGCGAAPQDVKSSTRNTYYNDSLYADFPVIYVTWNQADAYCIWAGRRLPSEAEWEKAARGTDGRTFPWGNNVPTSNLMNRTSDTTKVGSYPAGASPYGVLDMEGNVGQWLADWFGSYTSGKQNNPQGPATGSKRVYRGLPWRWRDHLAHSAFRISGEADIASDMIGFRCAMSITP